ncbi:virulence factor TspB C-terminal domain-related protein [Cupriavidus sp. CuC1]|uniref:virulence factor TspB C-terminal domain-related protein n=1 Tax=Cupriavidus sp. CuC1 TaxID=3373131 RepID=UPI0037D4AB34
MYDETQDKPPSLQSCADQGKVYGTFNGVGMCATAGSIPGSTVTMNDTKTSMHTDASGVAAAPQTETVSYSVGNVNGQAMVTATVTHADGSKDQVTQTQDGFCKDNPSSSPCTGGGGGGGGGGNTNKGTAAGGDDCTTPPACTGDAIACMMIKQQYKTRCELQKDDGPNGAVALGQKLANGQDPQASTLPSPSNATQVDLSARLSNVDDMGIAAQCLPDLHIPLGALPGSNGSMLNISTGPLCDFGKLFGVLNMLGTLALCAYMLRGSF